jgi:hypothetical protein
MAGRGRPGTRRRSEAAGGVPFAARSRRLQCRPASDGRRPTAGLARRPSDVEVAAGSHAGASGSRGGVTDASATSAEVGGAARGSGVVTSSVPASGAATTVEASETLIAGEPPSSGAGTAPVGSSGTVAGRGICRAGSNGTADRNARRSVSSYSAASSLVIRPVAGRPGAQIRRAKCRAPASGRAAHDDSAGRSPARSPTQGIRQPEPGLDFAAARAWIAGSRPREGCVHVRCPLASGERHGRTYRFTGLGGRLRRRHREALGYLRLTPPRE